MSHSPHILIADDDDILRGLLTEYLKKNQLHVSDVVDGESTLRFARENPDLDLIVLDVMMPVKDGFDVLRELRTFCDVPVIMLTARGEELDRIVGLEMGADDYLPKPCNPRELLARIKAILRRGIMTERDSYEVGDLTLRVSDRSVMVDKALINLTPIEFDLLHLLMKQAGKAISKEAISLDILGRPLEEFDRSIDMHISNLRKKTGPGLHDEPRIKTIRGVGYLFVPEPDA